MNFHNLIWIWIAIAVLAFCLSLKVAAPYGRHTNKNWGPMISNRWGWIIMELPALLLCPLLFVLGSGVKSSYSWLFIGLWVLHYFNRTLIFPNRINTKGKKMPWAILSMAFFFNVINGAICGYYLGYTSPQYAVDWWSDPRFIAGIILFFAGMFINWQSDNILIGLRKPGEVGYKIPQGRLFRRVSCPNLLGEIIEWIGFALMTWSLPTASFAIWTFANLSPRAWEHHKWYLSKFDNYPKTRRALIPFLW